MREKGMGQIELIIDDIRQIRVDKSGLIVDDDSGWVDDIGMMTR